MPKTPTSLTAALGLGLAALVAAVTGGCSSGDASSGGGRNSGADRGALEGPVSSITSELYDMVRLRDQAFLSGGSDTNSFPMVEDTRTNAVPLQNHPKLHYSAIRHTGFLASITTNTGNLNSAVCFGPDLGPGVGWSNYFPCVPATIPRWSLNNEELLFTLPLATDTMNPVWFGGPPLPPTLKPATPTNRYILNQWQTPDFGNPDPAGFSIHEYYLREPYIPDASGSRPLSAFQNRYGRIGFIRSAMDLWGYGSISEAATMSRNVLGPGVGHFLSPPATPMGPSPFRGTFIYRVDNLGRPPFKASFWPGAPDLASGNAPITYGWSIDPETGDPVGVAIHAAGNVALCSCVFEIRFTPYSFGGGAFQPTFNGNVPQADSDANFDRVPAVYAPPPAPTTPEPDPALQYNGDPLLHIYPIHYKCYSSTCIPFSTPIVPDPYTVIDEMIRDSAYQPNEVFIVPVLKPEWNGKMPQGTYRIQITVTGPPGTCAPTAPTEDAQHQLRYFHVWNSGRPNYFRP